MIVKCILNAGILLHRSRARETNRVFDIPTCRCNKTKSNRIKDTCICYQNFTDFILTLKLKIKRTLKYERKVIARLKLLYSKPILKEWMPGINIYYLTIVSSNFLKRVMNYPQSYQNMCGSVLQITLRYKWKQQWNLRSTGESNSSN